MHSGSSITQSSLITGILKGSTKIQLAAGSHSVSIDVYPNPRSPIIMLPYSIDEAYENYDLIITGLQVDSFTNFITDDGIFNKM